MGRGEIHFYELRTPLGEMVGGATDGGVSFLLWLDRGGMERVRGMVERRYRMPLVAGGNPHLNQLEEEIDSYFGMRLKEFRVKIDVKGTPFEMKTWEELLRIPYGETRSYSDIAKSMGRPEAQRAVGRAAGANPLSIVIPCHRVIAANGKPGGFGGSLWRKIHLLDLEAGLKPKL